MAAVAGGAWVGALLAGPWWLAVAGPLTLLLLVVAGPRRGRAPELVAVVAAVAVVTSGLAGARLALAAGGGLARVATEGAVVAVTGRVATEPRGLEGGGWWLLLAVQEIDGRPDGGRAFLRLPAEDGTSRDRAAGTGIHVQPGPSPGRSLSPPGHPPGSPGGDRGPESDAAALPFGAVVQVRAAARPLEGEGFEGYLRRLGVGFALLPRSGVVVVRPAPAWLQATTTVRANLRAATRRHLDRDAAALLSGLVTGDTAGLSPEREDALRRAGLSHLVAVSGSNVALVVAGAAALGRGLRLGERGRRRLILVVLAWFVVLARAEPSVLRAAAVAALVIAASALGRSRDPVHALPAGVLLLLLADPLLAAQPGFALSVAAAAGVLIVGPRVVTERIPGPRRLRVVLGPLLGAQVAVVPVLLLLDGVPTGAVPANLLALPASALASTVGIVVAVVAQLSGPVAGVVAVAAAPAVHLVLWSGDTFASWPAVTTGDLAGPLGLLLLGLGAALFARSAPERVRSVSGALAAALVVAAAAGAWPVRAGPVTGLAVTALDVGQGDAVLVRAGAAALLVDAGPAGGDVVGHLRRLGIGRLDALLISHPHADHVGGAPAVVARVPIGALLLGPDPLDPAAVAATEAFALEAAAAARGIPTTRVAAGDRVALGPLLLDVLSPPAERPAIVDLNERSVVVRASAEGCTALLAGDAEVAAQTRLLASGAAIRAHVLKIPHHGGDTNAAGFLDAVGADVAVVSAGRDNDFGHPDPAVLADLLGTTIRRTDLEGTVDLRLAPCHAARAPP